MLLYSNGVKSICNQIGFDMDGKRIKFESQCNHLGIIRDIKPKVNIEEIISLGRNTAYALMGVGLHSGNGPTKTFMCLLMAWFMVLKCRNYQRLMWGVWRSFKEDVCGKTKGF